MKRVWLLALPLIAAALWFGASSSQGATAPLFKVNSVTSAGCTNGDWDLDVTASDLPTTDYIAHTVVTSGGLVYMNENASGLGNFHGSWNLYSATSYGPTTGTYPIPAGQPMKAVFTLERPLGNVVSSWTMVAKSCDSKALLWNGLTAEDTDGDYLSVYKDTCPVLASARANGCPARARTFALAAATGPKRVLAQLAAPGYPALANNRTVVLWKVRPGPDLRVASKRTGAAGGARFLVAKGTYYATTPGLILPQFGQAYAKRTPAVTVK